MRCRKIGHSLNEAVREVLNRTPAGSRSLYGRFADWQQKRWKGGLPMAQLAPLNKRRRNPMVSSGIWYGLSPVARAVPSGRVYD